MNQIEHAAQFGLTRDEWLRIHLANRAAVSELEDHFATFISGAVDEAARLAHERIETDKTEISARDVAVFKAGLAELDEWLAKAPAIRDKIQKFIDDLEPMPNL